MQISIKATTETARQFLEEVERRVRDTTPAWRAVGEYVRGSVVKTFEAEGRPEKWPALSPVTLMLRARGKKLTRAGFVAPSAWKTLFSPGYAKILQHTGRLKKEIGFKAGREKVVIGTSVIYAAIHQFGGMAGRGRKVKIPARPYLVLQPEDQPVVEKIVGDYLVFGKSG